MFHRLIKVDYCLIARISDVGQSLVDIGINDDDVRKEQ
jgi:hypothetical protein